MLIKLNDHTTEILALTLYLAVPLSLIPLVFRIVWPMIVVLGLNTLFRILVKPIWP